MPAVAVALDSQALASTFNDHVNPEISHLPLRVYQVARNGEPLEHFAFEGRFCPTFFLIEGTQGSLWVFDMAKQLEAQVG
jgi:hypothetical protein